MLPKEVDLKKCSLFNTLFKINFQMAILLRLADKVEEVLARVNLGGGWGEHCHFVFVCFNCKGIAS